MYYRLLFFCLTLLSVNACKEEAPPLPPEEKQEIISLIHHEAYVVTVDNLRMRDRPGRKSEVQRKLPEGSIVLSEGERSDFTEEITLRGKTYDEPYHKVYLRNREDKQGWVYGGALLKIYHDETAYPFSVNMDGLINNLMRKDYRQLSDLQAALQMIVQERSNVPEWNDALLVLAEHVLEPAARSEAVHAEVRSMVQDAADMYNQVASRSINYDSLVYGDRLRNAGLALEAEEGMIFPVLDKAHLAQLIKGPFSTAGEAYVDLLTELRKQKLVSDAAIVVPMQRVVDLYMMSNQFLSTFDERSVFYDKVEELADHLKRLITEGTVNTPARDHGDGQKVSEMHAAGWQYLLEKYPDSELAKEVAK